jgi:adenylate kinase family enzyme
MTRLGTKILIVGSGGAGKSTLALRLGARTGLPVIHLDRHFWKPGWQQPELSEWRAEVASLITAPAWIMDGNFGDTMLARVQACDMIVFLDLPRWVCMARVVMRAVRYRGKRRPDLPDGCPEQLDGEFLLWLWNFPKNSRPRILEKLAAGGSGKTVLRFTSQRQVDEWLRGLPDPTR